MNHDHLFELLTAYRGDRAFNQYRDVHPGLDLPHGAAVRRRNLRCYLETFARARFALVGEAAGYAGCRFSGIPFTCEAQLVGPERLGWTDGQDLARSSTAETPWVERSDRIVWEGLGERADCVLWNGFPWHPFGEGNPEPVFVSEEAIVVGRPHTIGRNGNHLSMQLRAGEFIFRAVGFGMAKALDGLDGADEVSVAYVPVINSWRGADTVELELRDIVVDGRSVVFDEI